MAQPQNPQPAGQIPAHRRLDDLDPAILRAVGDLGLPPLWVPPQGPVDRQPSQQARWRQPRVQAAPDLHPGDDVRRVDWALYGRSKRLYTRLVQDEHLPRLVLALDTSASMATGGWPDKFRATIELCLQLALIGLNSG